MYIYIIRTNYTYIFLYVYIYICVFYLECVCSRAGLVCSGLVDVFLVLLLQCIMGSEEMLAIPPPPPPLFIFPLEFALKIKIYCFWSLVCFFHSLWQMWRDWRQNTSSCLNPHRCQVSPHLSPENTNWSSVFSGKAQTIWHCAI